VYKPSDELISLIEEISSSVSGSRIFWKLFKNSEMSLSEIIRQTNLNHKIVRRNIRIMIEKGLVKEKAFGRFKIYVLNQDNPRVQMLMNLIKQASYGTPP
jgi:predicted transcriptional regulator